MTPKFLTNAEIIYFSRFIRSLALFALGTLSLALFGFFHILPIAALFILCSYDFFHHTRHTHLDRGIRILLSLALILILLLSLFAQQSIFSGRDQGAIAEAAIQLAHSGTLTFSSASITTLFDLHESGLAQNFPGFYYTDEGSLTTHFPLPYITWLGAFYVVFGMYGITIANALLFFVFLYSFYMLARYFMGHAYGLVAALFAITTFPLIFFSKYTLSENMALAFLWAGITLLILYFSAIYRTKTPGKNLQHRGRMVLTSLFLTFAVILFVRIEDIVFFAAMSVLIFLTPRSWTFIKNFLLRRTLAFYTLIITLFAIVFSSLNNAFFRNVGKAFFGTNLEIATDTTPLFARLFSDLFTNLHTLTLYGMLPFIVIGLFGIFWAFYRKHWRILIVLFMTLPAFIYIFDAFISGDHPWMIRRYTFAVIPTLFFFTTLFFSYWSHSKRPRLAQTAVILPFFITAIVLYNLNITAPFYTYSEHRNLPDEITALSQHFSVDDLILIDRGATGDPWAMMDGPLRFEHDRHAVYFFNPADYERLDTTAFDTVYLVVPRDKEDFYYESVIGDKLNYDTKYMIRTNRLTPTRSFDDIAPQEELVTRGVIFTIDK